MVKAGKREKNIRLKSGCLWVVWWRWFSILPLCLFSPHNFLKCANTIFVIKFIYFDLKIEEAIQMICQMEGTRLRRENEAWKYQDGKWGDGQGAQKQGGQGESLENRGSGRDLQGLCSLAAWPGGRGQGAESQPWRSPTSCRQFASLQMPSGPDSIILKPWSVVIVLLVRLGVKIPPNVGLCSPWGTSSHYQPQLGTARMRQGRVPWGSHVIASSLKGS